MYRRILFIVTCLLFVSCDNSESVYMDNDDYIAVIDTDCAAIVNYEPEDFTIKRMFHGKFAKASIQVLTIGEARLLDKALYQFLAFQIFVDMEWFEVAKRINPEARYTIKNFMIDITNYRRQYIIVLNKKGERVVWCNFFCDDIPAFGIIDWKHKALGGFGGGNCFFNFKVNLATGKCFDVSVNAEA